MSVIQVQVQPQEFNASIVVTDLLMKTLENCAKGLVCRVVSELASRHNFDVDEELQTLGLEKFTITRKAMAKKSAAVKPVKEKKEKSKFPMPFEGATVRADCCQGLSYNRGLYTQCQKKIWNQEFSVSDAKVKRIRTQVVFQIVDL